MIPEVFGAKIITLFVNEIIWGHW